MTHSTTPQDDKAMSPASTGSVSEPLAFAVMQPDSYVVVPSLQSAFAMRDMCGGGDIVPLYRSPTLTDAEREAIERAWDTLRCLQADYGKTQTEQDAHTLRELWERTKEK